LSGGEQTSFFSNNQTPHTVSTRNYLADIFSENVDVPNSKFERVVFDLFNFVYLSRIHDNGFGRYGRAMVI